MRKLTNKQKLFVKEYLIDLNASQAAIRAGYSKTSANQIATELLGKTVVINAIQKAMDKRTERTKINADYVLNRLVEIDQLGNDRAKTIGNNEISQIGNNQKITVGNSLSLLVAGNSKLKLDKDNITLEIGDSRLVLTEDSIYLTAPDIHFVAEGTINQDAPWNVFLNSGSADEAPELKVKAESIDMSGRKPGPDKK